MPSYNTLGIVLRRINYGETDKIIALYSRDLGRISAIAKGARKAISRFSGATEVLSCTRFQLATGKSLEVVSQCEIHTSFSVFRQDLTKMANALYLAELLDHNVEDRVPNERLFDLLYSALHLLERSSLPSLVSRWFELRLLGELGYAPNLETCAMCDSDVVHSPQDAELALSPTHGGILCHVHAHPRTNPDHNMLNYNAMRNLRALQLLEPDEADQLQESQLENIVVSQTERALRQFMRFHNDREMKSRAFLDSLKHVA